MRFSTDGGPRCRAAAGYTLAEVVVSLTVFIAILVAVLFTFNLNYRLARGRSDTALRMEAVRGAQHDLIRLLAVAGRGGLPHELAIDVRTNVAPGSHIGGPGSPRVVAGTDVLTLRGVFSAPLFRVGPADGSLRLGDTGTPPTGVVEIRDPSPQTGVAQNLAELAALLEAGASGSCALLLVSQLDESVFAVVRGAPGDARISRLEGRVNAVTLSFDAAGPPAALAGAGAAAALRGAAFVGILEEYRFYVREAFSAPGDETSAPRQQLSVARFVPGTDQPWAAADPFTDLADNITDLQIALGIDIDGDGRVVADSADPGADEWLYNDPGDAIDEPRWGPAFGRMTRVRVTLEMRAERPEPGYLAPPRQRLEDRLPGPADEARDPRAPDGSGYRRWRLESRVDLESGSSLPRAARPSGGAGQSR